MDQATTTSSKLLSDTEIGEFKLFIDTDIGEFKALSDLDKKGEFAENDPFCRLIYTDFYKRLDKFFKKKYDEQVNNCFDPDLCRCKRRLLKSIADFVLEKLHLNTVRFYLEKLFSKKKEEEALIVNISEDKDVIEMLNYFNRLVNKRENYAKQMVLITICLWMTILNRRDFFEADKAPANADSTPVQSKSNRLFSAFKVFTTKKEIKEETKTKKDLGSPADENNVISCSLINFV